MSHEVNNNSSFFTNSTLTTSNDKNTGNWFESMAEAWGNALDDQANRILQKSEQVAHGLNSPAEITELTAESLRMSFVSNSSHTSLTSVGSALDTLARKQ